jgi:hypothetical protein
VLPFFAGLDAALVGIEACHTAHYWGREIAALGHDVRLMPPQFVKPYVKSQKNRRRGDRRSRAKTHDAICVNQTCGSTGCSNTASIPFAYRSGVIQKIAEGWPNSRIDELMP